MKYFIAMATNIPLLAAAAATARSHAAFAPLEAVPRDAGQPSLFAFSIDAEVATAEVDTGMSTPELPKVLCL